MVTSEPTTIDVRHFVENLPASMRKKIEAATIAIEMVQKEMPTKSFGANITVSALAMVGENSSAEVANAMRALPELIFIIYLR